MRKAVVGEASPETPCLAAGAGRYLPDLTWKGGSIGPSRQVFARLKPQALDEEVRAIVQTRPTAGARILAGGHSEPITLAAEIAALITSVVTKPAIRTAYAGSDPASRANCRDGRRL